MASPEIQSWALSKLRQVMPHARSLATADLRWTLIGADRGFTGDIFRASWAGGSVIVKVPDTTENFDRCAREAHFLKEIGDQSGVNTPRLLASHLDRDAAQVWLILEDITGREGDAADGCDATTAAQVLATIAPMHTRWAGDERLQSIDWLPRWGSGQVDSPHPHRRRAERFRKRAPLARERLGDRLSPVFARVIERLEDEFESLLAEVAAWPGTLIHADIHLDNLIWRDTPGGEQLVFLDWQSASYGPPLYDVTSFLVESLHGEEAHRQVYGLLDRYAARCNALTERRAGLTGRKGHEDERPTTAGATGPTVGGDGLISHADFRTMVLVVIAGFISAYGNPKMTERPPRLQELFHRWFWKDRALGLVEFIDPA